jgi:hypothetical protein
LRLGALPAAAESEPRYADASRITDPGWRVIEKVLAVLALLAFLGYFAVYVAYAADLFRWPYDYDQGESFELYDAVLHSRGEWPYRDSSAYPFYSSNYPPVFHILNILLFPLFGPTLLSGRVLSFVVTLLTAAVIGLTVRRRTGGVFLPLLMGLAYLASNFIYHIGPLCRQHLRRVFFEALCVYFIAKAEDPARGPQNVALGLTFLLFAGYCKQLAVFTAAAVFGYLFLRNPRRAVGWVIVFGAVFGLVFLSINWATDGQWWINTISANVNEFIFPQLWGLIQSWFKIHLLFVLLAFGMTLYEAYGGQFSVYTLWFVAALGTGAMSGQVGAGEAYWATSGAAALVLSGFALSASCGDLGHAAATALAGLRRSGAAAACSCSNPRGCCICPLRAGCWGTIARILGVAGPPEIRLRRLPLLRLPSAIRSGTSDAPGQITRAARSCRPTSARLMGRSSARRPRSRCWRASRWSRIPRSCSTSTKTTAC